VAPPPPPSSQPAPVVVEAGDDDPSGLSTAGDGSATEIAGFLTEVDGSDPRLAGFRSQWGPAAGRLLTVLARRLAADGGLFLRFRVPS